MTQQMKSYCDSDESWNDGAFIFNGLTQQTKLVGKMYEDPGCCTQFVVFISSLLQTVSSNEANLQIQQYTSQKNPIKND